MKIAAIYLFLIFPVFAEKPNKEITYLKEEKLVLRLNKFKEPIFFKWGVIEGESNIKPPWLESFQVSYFLANNPNITFENWYSLYDSAIFASDKIARQKFEAVKLKYPNPADYKIDEANKARSERVVLGEIFITTKNSEVMLLLAQIKNDFEDKPYDPNFVQAIIFTKVGKKYLRSNASIQPFDDIVMPFVDISLMESIIDAGFFVKGKHSKAFPLRFDADSPMRVNSNMRN